MDPELGANLVELGLVNKILFENDHLTVHIGTTSPSCPMGEYLVDASNAALKQQFPKLAKTSVLLTWNPEWSPECMSSALRKRFGWTDEK